MNWWCINDVDLISVSTEERKMATQGFQNGVVGGLIWNQWKPNEKGVPWKRNRPPSCLFAAFLCVFSLSIGLPPMKRDTKRIGPFAFGWRRHPLTRGSGLRGSFAYSFACLMNNEAIAQRRRNPGSFRTRKVANRGPSIIAADEVVDLDISGIPGIPSISEGILRAFFSTVFFRFFLACFFFVFFYLPVISAEFLDSFRWGIAAIWSISKLSRPSDSLVYLSHVAQFVSVLPVHSSPSGILESTLPPHERILASILALLWCPRAFVFFFFSCFHWTFSRPASARYLWKYLQRGLHHAMGSFLSVPHCPVCLLRPLRYGHWNRWTPLRWWNLALTRVFGETWFFIYIERERYTGSNSIESQSKWDPRKGEKKKVVGPASIRGGRRETLGRRGELRWK